MILTSSYFKEIAENLTKRVWMAITELDNIYMGEEGKSLYLETSVPPPPPNTHIFMWSVCIPGAGTSVSRFCSSSLRFNWISSHRSQACHCGQALLTIATGPALRRGFRAKLITCLPFWLITEMVSAATCHWLLREGALLCLHLWGEPVLSPPVPGVPCEKTEPIVASVGCLCPPTLSSQRNQGSHTNSPCSLRKNSWYHLCVTIPFLLLPQDLSLNTLLKEATWLLEWTRTWVSWIVVMIWHENHKRKRFDVHRVAGG